MFYTIPINRNTITSGFRIFINTGNDPLRVAIYRGFVKASPVSNATLVGESASTIGIPSLPFTSGAITAVVGQTLTFTAGEYMTLGFGSFGTLNAYLGSASLNVAVIDMSYVGINNYVVSGFPSVMTTALQLSATTTKVCLELY